MKSTALSILTLLVAAACSTAGAGNQTGSELPTGKEIGEKVSKRTKDADVRDNSGVIIASSEDGREETTAPPPDNERATDEDAPIGTWIEVGPNGTMTGANGEILDQMPESDEAGKIIVRHRKEVSSERIATTIENLRGAGWSEITVTMVADTEDETGDDAGDDTGAVDVAAPSGGEDDVEEEDAE